MKVAYLVGHFPTTRETFIINEVSDLVRRGVDVEIFSWRQPTADEVTHPEVAENRLLNRTRYYRIRYLWRVVGSCFFWRTLWMTRQPVSGYTFRTLDDRLRAAYFATLLRSHRHRHLHAHFVGMLGETMAQLAGLSYSFTAHCYEADVKSSGYSPQLAEAVKRASTVVAASEFVRNGLRKHAEKDRQDDIHVVRCGIDAERFLPNQRIPKDIDILSVAGFSKFKGLEYLIEAAGLLKSDGIETKVAIAGWGPPERVSEMLAARSRAGAEGVVDLLGRVDSQQVRDLLTRSKIFVLPSIVDDDGHMDGLPVALMEAAAMELPLISTDVAGIPELVIDGVTGIVVPQRDPRALAGAIQTLLRDDELRERLGKAARQRVLEEFTREMNGERLLAVLRPYIDET